MPERDFAVVIGIDRYDPELRELNGAVNDATAMHEWLVTTAGVPERHAFLVVSREKRDKPQLGKINKTFSELRKLALENEANGRLYFYFAGHGCSADRDHANLLMANARLDDLMLGMNAREYEKQLRWRAWFAEQLFFYDCCRTHDHAALGSPPSFSTLFPEPGSSAVLQLSHHATRWQLESVERPTEEELEYRGLFTRALLDGLSGWASEPDWEGEDVITAGSLWSYVKLRLRELTRHTPITQEPAFIGEPNNELVIAKVARRLTPVHVIAPPSASVIRIWEHGQAAQPHAVVGGIACVELPPRVHGFTFGGAARVHAVPTSTDVVEIDLR